MNISIETIERLLEKHGRCIDMLCNDYAEPGYKKENNGDILFSNWNDVPKHIMTWLEKNHTLEWSDEWSECDECNNAVRTISDSYGWTAYNAVLELVGCTFLCGDCIKDDPDDYLEELTNNSDKADTILGDLTKYGYKLIDKGFENGWHPGQTDEPAPILAEAQEQYPHMDFIFGNISVGQFDIHFDLYGKKVETN